MRRFLTLGALTLIGCGGEDEVDRAGADALWQRLLDADYRTTFQSAPGWETPQATVGAHGRTAVILMNPVIAGALESGGLAAWPDGSLIVKDSYDAAELTLVAALEKQSGSWFFAEWTANGAVKYAGEPAVCTNCHLPANDRLRAITLPD
jgi:hypothetical protein